VDRRSAALPTSLGTLKFELSTLKKV
jgi:hypothetical protein